MATDIEIENQHIIFFDGVCNLCNASINFVIDRDPHAHFRFASLQSEEAQKILTAQAVTSNLESILYYDQGQLYERSEAALRIARQLGGGWSLLYGFMIIPRFIRDGVYNWIARNRYKWFGRRDSCRLPTSELQQRFLGSLDVF